MPKLISEAEFEAATHGDLAAAIRFRLEATESLIWADLDAVNDRIPGFGDAAKLIVAEGLERLATNLRSSSLPNWKKA
jgi:hypothetical protein